MNLEKYKFLKFGRYTHFCDYFVVKIRTILQEKIKQDSENILGNIPNNILISVNYYNINSESKRLKQVNN